MKKVLITGSNGLLGQKLSDLYLTLPDCSFLATGTGMNRHPAGDKVPYQTLDIRDAKAVMDLFMEFRPDCVIHTAAMTNVDQCESEKEACWDLNVHAVASIVDACNTVNAHLIHLSTDFIFDGKAGPYSETAMPNPISYYGESKLAGEKLVQEKAQNWAIVRTVLVYGIVNDMSRSNIVLWAKGALEAGKAINVVTDQFRSPTLAEDLAMGCRLIEKQKARGIYHISGKDFMSVYELVERVAIFWNLPMDNVNPSDSSGINQPAKRPPITGFIIDKAIRELGYAPHSFEEGMGLLSDQLRDSSK
ncbi:MAG TPA: NAD(P)-dependent oxidoreductase [Bacteroidetes bacterium]|nr:NAD(P)-dependent oxidoreductase [Bacteroidota bacterium]